MAAGLGALALGTLDGGLTAGAIIGGSALIRAFGEARSKHGLESKAHIERTRLAIMRAVALDDLDEAARDSVGLADTALAAHLGEAMPSREELGAAAVNLERYPVAACALILDRLEARDLLFRDDAVARDFATRVIIAALQEGLNNPDYIALLSVHILTAVAQGVAEANTKLDRVLALLEGSTLTDQALRSAIARFIAFQPNASDADVLNAVATFEREYRALLEQVSHITVNDNHIQSLKVAAEEALKAGDIATARIRYGEAAKAAADKASEPVRNAAALKSAEASTALTMLDWQAADAAWEQAAAMLMPFDVVAGEAIVWEAGVILCEFGEIFAQTSALIASVRCWRSLAAAATQRGDTERAAMTQVGLGNVLAVMGERTESQAGQKLLSEAVDAYRAALTIHTKEAMSAEWAMTQNNLGSVLRVQSERTQGEAGFVLLEQAVAAFHAALTIGTQAAMPLQWAMTQNNLGNALAIMGGRTAGELGLALLAEAVKAFRAALTVYTQIARPAQSSGMQNNLGNALRILGARTEGEAGLALLTQAVAAFRAALTVHTETATPAYWAMTQNNLGNVLQEQGARTKGGAGLALLAQAVEAFRLALTILTPEHFSHQHKITSESLARAEAAIAARRG